MKYARIIRRSILTLAPLAACALIGCSSAGKGESLFAIRNNLTPGMNTENERYSDVQSNIDLVNNDNMRKFNSDNMRFWLWDRPSRLSPAVDAR
ncbi:MAG: hypothetical protein K2Y21_01195 [Phycisphaerales bacterium]|nr:hypothetical protein [Phycisphaerales bacterium]